MHKMERLTDPENETPMLRDSNMDGWTNTQMRDTQSQTQESDTTQGSDT